MRTPGPMDTALSFDPPYGEPRRDGDQGYTLLPDGKALIRIKAPGAREVALDQLGRLHPLHPVSPDMWEGEIDLGRGLQYFFLKIDGCDVLSPYLPIGFGCCRPMHFLDIPVPGEDWDSLEGAPHGAVTRHYYPSAVTGKWEVCLVYTPAGFDRAKRYPTLYLLHGYGENETAWVYQGHVNRIADQLLFAGAMKEMIIVMGNGMTMDGAGNRRRMLFPQVLTQDLVPFIERTYPVYAGQLHRAIAGLSMGSYQTSLIALTHPDLFSHVGLFSGFLRALWAESQNEHLALLDSPEQFRQSFRLFYRAMGTEDQYFPVFQEDDALLRGKGIATLRRTFPGRHEWAVWRRCVHDFLPLLFWEEADK